MLRRTLLHTASFAALLGGAGEARAQASIRPDPTPRVPPQPGQGLPLEDVRFLRGATALSTAEAEAAAATAQAGDEEVRRFAAHLAERHRGLAEQIAALARARGVDPAAAPGTSPGGRVAEAKRRLEALRGAAAGDGRAFLTAQLELHPVLVEMYQTQASNTTDHELGSFAIRTLVGVQEDFATAVRLGEGRGLRRPEHLLSNPPQYGPGAGPPR
jgi:predicted outer membrane protein